VEQDNSHALVGVDMYDGYTLAPKGQICRTTHRSETIEAASERAREGEQNCIRARLITVDLVC
jgi:hypothetical protein